MTDDLPHPIPPMTATVDTSSRYGVRATHRVVDVGLRVVFPRAISGYCADGCRTLGGPVTLPTPTIPDPASDGGATGVDERRRSRWHLVVLALIAYVPLLLTHPGWIAADTKAYLYLDPTAAAARPRATCGTPTSGWDRSPTRTSGTCSRWGPGTGSSTSSASPPGSPSDSGWARSLFAAATGVRYLARLLGVGAWGQLAAALTYMLTPYLIDYLARTSAILMPWAGPRLAGGLHRRRRPTRRLALPGALRPRRRADRRRERDERAARRPRARRSGSCSRGSRRRRRGATSGGRR